MVNYFLIYCHSTQQVGAADSVKPKMNNRGARVD